MAIFLMSSSSSPNPMKSIQMICILLLPLVGLVCSSTITSTQEAQLVYDQHFVDTPQPQQIPYANQPNYGPHQVSPSQGQNWHHPSPSQQPNIAMFPPQQHSQPQFYNHYQPGMVQEPILVQSQPQIQHEPRFQEPILVQTQQQPQQQFQQATPVQPQQQQPQHGFMGQPHSMNQIASHGHQQHLHSHHRGLPHSIPPGAIPIPITNEFASRRGPIDKMIQGAKHYFPGRGGKKRRPGPGTPIRFMEMNRLPKPPKYPLYDMPDLGMATPPPPPLMSPMSSSSNMFSTIAHPPESSPAQRGGRAPPRGKKHPPPTHRRHQPPPMNRRNPRPGNHRSPPPSHHHHNNPRPHNRRPPHGNNHAGYEHTMMASSMDPQVSSPPLGRPLNFDEYMKRPSHSFTDDPWNFDPFAANYNSGMNTFAMKYNYDPLGMNSLDKTQTHLDPESLSFPGDYHLLQNSNGVDAGKVTQVGGWDQSPESYRTPSGLNPPPRRGQNHKNNGDLKLSGGRRNQQPNSFNVYDQTDSASGVKSESLNPLKILSDANPGIEFTIESSSNNDAVGETFKSKQPTYETAWNTYSQPGMAVYDGLGDSESLSSYAVNDYKPPQPPSQEYLKQLQESSKYENGNYDHQTQLHTFGLAQDYQRRDRPVSDLTDTYNPNGGDGSGGLSTDLTPPSETAAMFKRQGGQGSRPVRQDTTPLIELEGLSLFRDILKNEKAHETRNHLLRVLTN